MNSNYSLTMRINIRVSQLAESTSGGVKYWCNKRSDKILEKYVRT